MTIAEFKPWKDRVLEQSDPWVKVIEELDPDVLFDIFKVQGVLFRKDSHPNEFTYAEIFCLKHEKECAYFSSFNLKKIPDSFSFEPPALDEIKDPIEKVLLAFFQYGENPFPPARPHFFIQAAIQSSWSYVTDYLLSHTNCPPVKDLENTMIHCDLSDRKKQVPALLYLSATADSYFLKKWIDKGINLKAKDNKGLNALCYVNTYENAKILVDAGVQTDIKDNAGNDLSALWVKKMKGDNLEKTLGLLKSNPTQDLEIEILKMFTQAFQKVDKFNPHYYAVHKETADDLNVDWEKIKDLEFERNLGKKSFKIKALDFIALFATKPNAIQNPGINNAQLKKIVESFKEGQQVSVLKDEEGFAYRVFLGDSFGVDKKLIQNTSLKNQIFFEDPFLTNWARKWDKTNDSIDFLIKGLTACENWFDLFLAAKKENWLHRFASKILNHISHQDFVHLIENPKKIMKDPQKVEEFLTLTFRSSWLTPLMVEKYLVGLGKAKIPESPHVRAAILSGMTSFYYYCQGKKPKSSERRLCESIETRLEDWFKEGIDWPATAADKKWFSKVNKLKESDLGMRLSTLAQQGWLRNNLSTPEVLNVSSPQPKRRL